MIRVLIVDDDKLVRKGLISAMPWKAFGMEIVGEANNGENALKFIETHPIDLLITDLSMPVMSGIELMRVVREKYPLIQIVVLSLHQDFEYVQEALRLGAIDYIAKIQLEQEQFEEVLSRIVKLMERQDGAKGASSDQLENGTITGGELYVYYSLYPNMEDNRISPAVPEHAAEAEPGIWYTCEPPAATAPADPNTAIIRFCGMEGMDRKTILQLIRSYGKKHLFYDYNPEKADICIQADELLTQDNDGSVIPMDKLKESWTAANWIYEDDVFQDQLWELKELRMPPVRLARIFFSLSDEWNRLYHAILNEPIAIEDFFLSWYRFELWLQEVRERIRLANTKPLFSPEIQRSIVKAMSLVQHNISEPMTSSEIAQMVNMSGSYFSQCFKQYVGRTYTDYVRDIRMERAKEYLRSTNKTIQWIAEQIGYSDEKYFSRLFREHVGALPSEYRQISNWSQH